MTGHYLNYPTSTNTVPYSVPPPGNDAPNPSNTANFRTHDFMVNGYDDGYAVTASTEFSSSQNYLTDVGAYTLSIGPFGTFDQGGKCFGMERLIHRDTHWKFAARLARWLMGTRLPRPARRLCPARFRSLGREFRHWVPYSYANS